MLTDRRGKQGGIRLIHRLVSVSVGLGYTFYVRLVSCMRRRGDDEATEDDIDVEAVRRTDKSRARVTENE